MVEMTNKALRHRHWSLLMEKTGHTFELVDFTMAEMFQMELYQHKTTVLEIINTAMNEVVIETICNNLIDKWSGMTFSLVPHMKVQIERG